MQFLEIFWDFGILGFSKILGFFQRFFWIFDEVYEDFQSNLPLDGIYNIQKLSETTSLRFNNSSENNLKSTDRCLSRRHGNYPVQA
jgi:hypothetical protein